VWYFSDYVSSLAGVAMNIATPQEQFASRKRLKALFYEPNSMPAIRAPISKKQDRDEASCPWPCFANDESFVAKELSLGLVLRVVADFYGVSTNDVISARQTAKVMEPRMVCYFLAKELTTYSYPRIGRMFGGRDHTTILSGYRAVVRRMAFDSALAKTVKTLRAKLEEGAV